MCEGYTFMRVCLCLLARCGVGSLPLSLPTLLTSWVSPCGYSSWPAFPLRSGITRQPDLFLCVLVSELCPHVNRPCFTHWATMVTLVHSSSQMWVILLSSSDPVVSSHMTCFWGVMNSILYIGWMNGLFLLVKSVLHCNPHWLCQRYEGCTCNDIQTQFLL